MAKLLRSPPTPQELKQREKAFMDDVMSAMATSMMIVIAMVFFLPRVISSLGVRAAQAPTYVGRTDHRELRAIPLLQWVDLIANEPYTAWVSCFIINDGPGTAEIAVNHPGDRFVMGPGETRTVDRTAAEEQILALFYIAQPGQTANLRITGEY